MGTMLVLCERTTTPNKCWRHSRTLGWCYGEDDFRTLEAPFPMGESFHCALLLDYLPPEEPLGTPLGNTLRIKRPKLDWRGP